MLRRGSYSLLLSFLLLFSAWGGAPGACPLPAPEDSPRACPCQQAQTDNDCHCPTDAPCQVSQAPQTQAPDMVVASLDWPQAPGLAAGGLDSLSTGPVLHLVSRPVPPAPPPEALYLQKSSLLI